MSEPPDAGEGTGSGRQRPGDRASRRRRILVGIVMLAGLAVGLTWVVIQLVVAIDAARLHH